MQKFVMVCWLTYEIDEFFNIVWLDVFDITLDRIDKSILIDGVID